MSVQLRIIGSDDPHRESQSLRDWIGRESLLRGRVRAEHQPIQPGEMGALEQVLIVTLGSGGAVTMLARSVTMWLQQRRSELRVEVTAPDGSRAVINASGPAADHVATLFAASTPDEENVDVSAGRASFQSGPDRHEPLF